MEYSGYQYMVLCEDKAHFHFARGWLEKKGAQSRRIAPWKDFPPSGSGKAYVQNNLAAALKNARQRAAKAKTILVVVIDADNRSVRDIVDGLSCTEDDPVFVVVPKWSIDTWARFLMESADHPDRLDESASCKEQYQKRAKFAQLGKKLAGINLEQERELPESLAATYTRIKAKKAHLRL